MESELPDQAEKYRSIANVARRVAYWVLYPTFIFSVITLIALLFENRELGLFSICIALLFFVVRIIGVLVEHQFERSGLRAERLAKYKDTDL